MKSFFEQRQPTSIHTQHFGLASRRARLFYGILLLVWLTISFAKIASGQQPTFHSNQDQREGVRMIPVKSSPKNRIDVSYIEPLHSRLSTTL